MFYLMWKGLIMQMEKMNEIDFKPLVLAPEKIKAYGVRYDESIFYCWDDETTPLYDKDPSLGGKLFTGLLYDYFCDSDDISWYEYYTEGYGDGEYVTFYPNGKIASYCIMKGYAFIGKLYKWHENGKLKAFSEKDENNKYIKSIEWNENGDIVYLLEDGVVKINKLYLYGR